MPGKSHQYTSPCPSFGNHHCMFICKVLLGKQEILNASNQKKIGPSIGYHSLWGKAGKHNEYIIERFGQAKPLYLIQYDVWYFFVYQIYINYKTSSQRSTKYDSFKYDIFVTVHNNSCSKVQVHETWEFTEQLTSVYSYALLFFPYNLYFLMDKIN